MLWCSFSLFSKEKKTSNIDIPNQFLNEILDLWAKVYSIEKDSLDQNAKKQYFGYNSHIRAEDKAVYYNN